MSRRVAYTAGMAAAWVMLWDQVTLANVVGGLLVAAGVLAVFPLPPVPPERRLLVRPLALLRLAGAVLADLVTSNVLVIRETLSRRRRLATGVVACPMATSSPKLLSTIANVLALSPGTMAVDATNDPPTLYVHVLTLGDPLDIRRGVAQLERMVIDALGSPADRAALAARRTDAVEVVEAVEIGDAP